jgi:DNA (cytosine-5)-methyltransferase 1
LFPGIGLLDMAFEQAGFCVVRGPDLIWGGDIRAFRPPSGVFWGVIGGPPCQDFSAARRVEPTGYGREMLDEFRRVVECAMPEWWLLENVARVPDVRIGGYHRQRFGLDQGWFEPVSRLRHFQYGVRIESSEKSLDAFARLLNPPKLPLRRDCVPGALASDDRPSSVLARLQGLPDDFDLPGMTEAGKRAAIGNGVPLVLGRVLARMVCEVWGLPCDFAAESPVTELVAESCRCACGCGRILTGRRKYASPACRKRAERARTRGGSVTRPVAQT